MARRTTAEKTPSEETPIATTQTPEEQAENAKTHEEPLVVTAAGIQRMGAQRQTTREDVVNAPVQPEVTAPDGETKEPNPTGEEESEPAK